MNFLKERLSFILWVALFLSPVKGTVVMPPLFGDHMVLQQGVSLPIWGSASPGEKILVQFVGQSGTTTADAQGRWQVNLHPVYLRSSPDVLTVEGNNHLQFSDVLVGEVWLCAGGSNMALPLEKASQGREMLTQAEDAGLRFFVVEKARSFLPSHQLQGHWERSTPMTAAGFSAVGYFFGNDLRSVTGVPIGLIGSYEEETPLISWVSLEALKEPPSFSAALAEYASIRTHYLEAQASYAQQEQEYQVTLEHWKKEVEEPYNREIANWREECVQARLKLQAQPVRPELAKPRPLPPPLPDGGRQLPSSLFNGMIAPLIPYAIAGVIWYQGESDEGEAAFQYRRLFLRLIRSWRQAWGEGPFPFYFVQLAGHDKKTLSPIDPLLDEERNFNPGWPWIREGQAIALTLPETGMALATDLGDPNNVVPIDKLSVGRRLGLLARHSLYGEKGVAMGPFYQGMKKEGSKIRIFFQPTLSGLTLGTPPCNGEVAFSPSLKLQGFAIAGANRVWEEAIAQIEGDSVLVWNEDIEHPEAVRYNWKEFPTGNLYNKAGLPAAPFRTDLDQPH